MLRHSPLGKSGNGTSGNGGSSGQEDSNNRYSGRRSRFAQSDDAGSVVSGDSGADNTNPSGKSTEISTRGAAREHRPLDIEREVRQQGGVRNDPGSRAQSESSVVVEESLAVSQARALLMQGLISAEELDAVVRKDQVGIVLPKLQHARVFYPHGKARGVCAGRVFCLWCVMQARNRGLT